MNVFIPIKEQDLSRTPALVSLNSIFLKKLESEQSYS